ncbi:MAG: hypothetical protein KDK50_06725, partial [Chlamydiia bacterium]|nr:hypothetical protein [Chlamydiia bacterium]
ILDQMSRILCEVDVLAMAQAVFPKVPVQNEQLSKRIQAIATFVFSPFMTKTKCPYVWPDVVHMVFPD